jgi:hypothetical protein
MSIKKDPYDFLGEDITGAMEVKVWAIGTGIVTYTLADPQVTRTWRPNELKILTFHELYQLMNHPGGAVLLKERLQIRDNKVRQALQLSLDPEYLYTEEDAKNLAINGTQEQILDALEFGPLGLASMIKHHAILNANSLDRVNFFNTLFSMNIQELRESVKDTEPVTAPETRTRRSAKLNTTQEESTTKSTRKSKPLKPSEQLVQVPTTEE